MMSLCPRSTRSKKIAATANQFKPTAQSRTFAAVAVIQQSARLKTECIVSMQSLKMQVWCCWGLVLQSSSIHIPGTNAAHVLHVPRAGAGLSMHACMPAWHGSPRCLAPPHLPPHPSTLPASFTHQQPHSSQACTSACKALQTTPLSLQRPQCT